MCFKEMGLVVDLYLLSTTTKIYVRNITNTIVPVNWGVEAVLAMVTSKQISQTSNIQNIAYVAIYSKPGSRHKMDPTLCRLSRLLQWLIKPQAT